jgi:hypothetical protein
MAMDQFPASSRVSKGVEEADEEQDDASNSRREISMPASSVTTTSSSVATSVSSTSATMASASSIAPFRFASGDGTRVSRSDNSGSREEQKSTVALRKENKARLG